ncbi:MAG: glucose-6-phosphate isomerase [Verrucomicrobia bacterium 21-51-4]|nr:MAG: glucose-6-phosphate isomerase [Verrucomicrobia bacterium 21-51-4]
MTAHTTPDTASLWARFKEYAIEVPETNFRLDISRMNFPRDYFSKMEAPMSQAFSAMAALEKGAIANPDENRRVGHYWLRSPKLAPTPEIRQAIESCLAHIHAFAGQVHRGQVQGAQGNFKNLLVIGIGGSALGPEFVAQALGNPRTDKLRPFFFDNTDPDGMDLVLSQLEGQLGQTLVIVISKSGGTPETRNGMLEAQAAYKRAQLNFAQHAVAITGEGSKLDQVAQSEKWITTFPMWDWVGGRTSELAAVGLVPAALQGIDINRMLEGAATMDEATRIADTHKNAAAQMALMWYWATEGKGKKDMVVLPYKDRLMLFSKYLQQLVMESLGKEKDLQGNIVHQGIAVYGNKGSTDQHAYVQQLRDGVPNFFVTFIEVLKDRTGPSIGIEGDMTSGDYLQGFLLGTREALYESGRYSITLTLPSVNAFCVGALIALYERAVGYYGSLVDVNAYHQPGVEAGKKAAADVLAVKTRLLDFLRAHPGQSFTTEEVAKQLGTDPALSFCLMDSLAACMQKQIQKNPMEPFYNSKFASARTPTKTVDAPVQMQVSSVP